MNALALGPPARPLKLAFIGHHVAPIRPPFAGGVESLTWYLARWLARRGHEVVLFGLPGSEVPGVEVRPLDMSPELSRDAQRDVSMPPGVFLDAHHAYQRALLDLARGGEDFDLVHIHSLHYLPVAMAELLGSPAVLTLHTPPTPWFESALLRQDHAGLHITAVSPETARMWRHAVPVADVISNGVDLHAWPAGPGGRGAMWCGRMVPEKAPHLAVRAARMAGLPIRLAGPVIDPAYFHARVAPLLGRDAVHLGHLDHADLAVALGSSAVALMTPEWDEPFGLAAVEAMATGTPVAAFARGGLPAIVDATAGRLAPPGDVPALADAALAAARLPRAGVREHARRCWGIDAMGQGYEAVYARACSRLDGALTAA